MKSKRGYQSKPLPFEEAIEYFRRKLPVTAEEYKKLQGEARQRAFTVGGITRLDILQDILSELRQALETGQTLQDFQKAIKRRMADKGWQGLTPHRVDTIFRTNVQTAFMVGRYKQMKSPTVLEARPIWLYTAVRDSGTRPSHLAMDGMARRHDDPIWEEWYPPNGFRCRCKVIALSPEAAARRGIHLQEGDLPRTWDKETGEILEMTPDDGFNINAGRDAWEPDLSRYDSDVRDAYLRNERKGPF